MADNFVNQTIAMKLLYVFCIACINGLQNSHAQKSLAKGTFQ